MSMFCYQCEQASAGKGCSAAGVCGKHPDVAALQDVLVYQVKGIGWLAHMARAAGKATREADIFTMEALFTTVTNVNFDADRLIGWITKGAQIRDTTAALYLSTGAAIDKTKWPMEATYSPKSSVDGLVADATLTNEIGVLTRPLNEDVRSLEELLIYGLKGLAAYADHAYLLGKTDDTIFAFVHEALAALTNPSITVDTLVGLTMKCGTVNVRTMEILDEANTGRYGNPVPTPVFTGIKKALQL